MNQQLFKKNFCNQSNHYGSHRVPTTKLSLFVVNKDEWDTKEDTMKNALHVQQYGKRHLSGWSELKVSPVALAIVELRKSEGIR